MNQHFSMDSNFQYIWSILIMNSGRASNVCRQFSASTRCDTRSTWWRWRRRRSTRTSHSPCDSTCPPTWKRISFENSFNRVRLYFWSFVSTGCVFIFDPLFQQGASLFLSLCFNRVCLYFWSFISTDFVILHFHRFCVYSWLSQYLLC